MDVQHFALATGIGAIVMRLVIETAGAVATEQAREALKDISMVVMFFPVFAILSNTNNTPVVIASICAMIANMPVEVGQYKLFEFARFGCLLISISTTLNLLR